MTASGFNGLSCIREVMVYLQVMVAFLRWLIYIAIRQSLRKLMASDPVASETAGPLVMPAAPKLPKPPKPARARADKQRRMTPAQLEWPLAWFPAYLEAQSQGRYDKFWPGFFRDWFEKFPPRKPTEDDPSNSESDNDSDNDGEDDVEEADNAKEADNNTGKQKCSANKLENKNKKKKKTVSLLASYSIPMADYLSLRNCLKVSHRIRRKKERSSRRQ